MIVHTVDRRVQQIQPGAERVMLAHGERLMLVEIALAEGCTVAPHAHPHEQASYVIRGVVRFAVAGQDVVLDAGESIHFPPNQIHGATALADSLLVDAFTPPREDFLA